MLEKYALSSKGLYDILVKKKITALHHANSVATSLTFIQQGALLSRDYVHQHGLIQTPQDSDAVDQLYNIWDAVFMDGEDHHINFDRNKYGPVLFKIKLQLLKDDAFSDVFIMRSNPTNWNRDGSTPLEKQYYDSLEEVEKDYLGESSNSAGIMFTFRSPEMNIGLADWVDSIILDDPKLVVEVIGRKIEARDFYVPLFKKALAESATPELPLLLRNNDFEGHLPCNCYWAYKHLQNYENAIFKKIFTRFGHYPELDIDELIKQYGNKTT